MMHTLPIGSLQFSRHWIHVDIQICHHENRDGPFKQAQSFSLNSILSSLTPTQTTLQAISCNPNFPSLQHSSLLLAKRLRLANILPPQVDLQHALHVAEDLLVGGRRPALVVGHHRRRLVDLGGQVLLRHRRALVVLQRRARRLDRVAHIRAYRLRLHDVVAAVHLREVLALGCFYLRCVSGGVWVRAGSVDGRGSGG